MIQTNNSNAYRKNTRDHLRAKRAGVSRRCNFIHSRIHHLPPLFWNDTKTRSGCTIGAGARDEEERLMQATRERTNGRRAVRDFRTRVYARSNASGELLWLLYEHRGYCYRYASCQPHFCLRVCARVYLQSGTTPIRTFTNASKNERASKLLVAYSRDIDTGLANVFLQPRAIRWPMDVTQ